MPNSDAQHPSKADPIFREALQCTSVQAREEFLAGVCGDDTTLLAEVRAMLRDHFVAEADPADATMPVTPGQPVNASGGEKAGDIIGRYTLLHVLGEGGFGSVWAAEQSEPVRREVALKILKLGMDTREVIARFEQERQALAVMDHPNIAKVLDGGATPLGRPYFVMELVKGEPVTLFCDQQQLSMTERLLLLVQVCHAVQHAHQKGIIHRDLKPSNILVSLGDDGRPVPRVIDFGIAKAVTPLSADASLLTQMDQFIGTPAYMSPEQAGLGEGDIDTRSDIYSLGVLLYELLTGTPPFDPKDLRGAGLEEMRRRIREEEPPRPSTRLSTVDETRRQDIAASRKTQLPKLVQSMRGDLDWVVMKALEKDRTRRYDSANGLAHDLERYLRQEPVTARAPSLGYTVGKFVRRNQGPVAAVAVIMLLIITGLVSSTLLYLREKSARARAETAERTAITQGQRSAQIAKFMQPIFEGIKPEESMGQDTRVLKKILDTASQRISRELGGQPEVEAELRQTIGRVYQSIGLYKEALPHLKGTLEVRSRVLGEEHPDTLLAMNNLAELYKDQGELTASESLFIKTLNSRRRVLGEQHPATLISMNNLALLYRDHSKLTEAEYLLFTLRSRAQGRLTEAESLLIKTLDVRCRVLGEAHPDTLTSMNNLALLYRDQRKLTEAESLLIKTLEVSRRVLGEEHPGTLTSMNNLALLYRDQGRLTEAESLLIKTLEVRSRVLGAEHPGTLTSMDILGQLYQDQHKLREAESLYTRTLEVRRRVLGEDHADTLSTLSRLTLLLTKALKVLRRSDFAERLRIVSRLAISLRDQKKWTEAEPLFEEEMELRRRTGLALESGFASAASNLGFVRASMKRFTEAEAPLREALSVRLKLTTSKIWLRHYCERRLGSLLLTLKKLDEAGPLLRSSYEGLKAHMADIPTSNKVEIVYASSDLAALAKAKGDEAEASKWTAEAEELRKEISKRPEPKK